MDNNENLENNKKRKKRHPIRTFFRIIIGLVFLALILAIALVIYVGVNISTSENFNGSERVQQIAKEDKPTSQVTQNVLYDSLESLKTSTSNEMDIALSEDNMNYLLHAASGKINLGKLKVKNIYMTYDSDTNYTIYMPCEFLMIKSCVYASCTIKYIETTDVVDMKINKINVGKLDTNNFIIKNFVLPNIDESSFENMFKNLDLNVKCNIDKTGFDIKIPSRDILNKLTSSINSNELFSVLFDTLNSQKKIGYSFTKTNIGLSADVSKAISTNPTDSIESSLVSVKANMQTLVNSKVVNNDNASIVFNYLVNGYEMLNENDKAVVKKIDFSSIGITSANVESYPGVISRSDDHVTFDIDFVRAMEYLTNREFTLQVHEETINHEIEKNKCVGLSSAVLNLNADAYSYLVVEDINTKIHDNYLDIVILLDVNSKETEVSIKLNKVSGEGKLVTNIDEITIGDLKVSETKYDTILKFVKDNVDLKYLSVDLENKQIILDFKDCGNTNLVSLIETHKFTPEYKLVEGRFELVYTIK